MENNKVATTVDCDNLEAKEIAIAKQNAYQASIEKEADDNHEAELLKSEKYPIGSYPGDFEDEDDDIYSKENDDADYEEDSNDADSDWDDDNEDSEDGADGVDSDDDEYDDDELETA